MRKSRLIPAALTLAALALTGCSSITNLFNQVTDTDTWTTEESGSGDVITSLNRYTDLINDVHTEMQVLDSDTSYFETDMDDYDSIGYEPYFTCSFALYDRDSLEYDTTNPAGLEAAESADLVSQVTAIFATVDKTEELCKELSKYVTAEDYKTDDFAQGQTLVADIYTNIDAYYDEHDKMLETLNTLYDKYDTFVVDSTDPVSVGIDNMNKDFDRADAILTLIEDAVNEENFDKMSEVQSNYDALSAALEAHYGDNAPAIDSYYSSNYNDFYNTLEVTFLPTVKRSLRNMEAQDVDALSGDYYDILDGYNSMVDSYNYFLDATGY